MEGKNRWQTQRMAKAQAMVSFPNNREAKRFPFTPSEFLLKQLRRTHRHRSPGIP